GRISFEQSARHLIQGMTNVAGLESAFIPSSWFSDIHDEIKDSMTIAYDNIIMKAMYIRLLQKAKAIFETAGAGVAQRPGTAKPVPVAEMAEFSELRTFVDNLLELERYADLYNSLRTSKNLNDLGRVVKYLFGIELPPGFYQNARYYHEALERTEYRVFDPKIFKIKAKFFTFRKLYQQLFERLFQNNVITAYLDVLSLQLENFGRETRTSARDGRLIRDLLSTVTETEKTLAYPALGWVGYVDFTLGSAFDELLSSVAQSSFLGADLRAEVEEEGRRAFHKLREDLKDKKTALTGPLLRREAGEVRLALSPGVLALQADLEKLLGQEFMTLEPVKGQEFRIPPGMRLIWDTTLLEEAVNLVRPYEGFIRTGLRNLPGGLQNIIKNMAQNSLEAKMLDLIGRAQNFRPLVDKFSAHSQEIAIRSEVRNFKEASKLLNRLLIVFDQLDLVDSFLDLSSLADWQTSTLLEAIDRLLMAEDLYAMRKGDFSWWDGMAPAAYLAFDVSGEEELQHYLSLQKERVRYLAFEYAEPVITFFLNSPLRRDRDDKGILFKWEKLLSELDKYESKKPKNSLTVLEKFVLFDMNKVNRDNYFKEIPPQLLSRRSGDYFLQKRNEIRRMLYARCERLAAEEISRQYGKIADFFNERLAGKFPFSRAQGGEISFEADPEDVRAFYIVFDEYAKEDKHLKALQGTFGPSGKLVLDFLARLREIREFFAPYLDGVGEKKEKLDHPMYDLLLEFRVNENHAQGANQIIEWKLDVADQEFRYMAEKNQGRWHFGDPIKLTLRWAKDSPDVPVYVMGHKGVKVDDRTVEYTYNNRWSLVHFLGAHAGSAADFDRMVDSKPHTLKFEIETRREGMGDDPEGKSQARVFVRTVVTVPDGTHKDVLVMPSAYPAAAPALEYASGAGKEG
ncbi:MAG: hypothetical protein JW821_02275, partial [Deltaproteobacteria bacterium]|nr:hypothetical protein [Deltaproteobacteria bacterium]